MVVGSGTPRSDDGYVYLPRYPSDELKIIAFHRAVPINGGKQDLAGAQVLHFLRPFDGISPGWGSTAAPVALVPAVSVAAHVDRHYHALDAEVFPRLGYQTRGFVGCGVDAYLVGSHAQQPADHLDTANSTANSQRHETFFREGADEVVVGVPVFRSGLNVEQDEFVHVPGVVDLYSLHRGADPAPAVKPLSLYKTDISHKQCGNDPGLEHQSDSDKVSD